MTDWIEHAGASSSVLDARPALLSAPNEAASPADDDELRLIGDDTSPTGELSPGDEPFPELPSVPEPKNAPSDVSGVSESDLLNQFPIHEIPAVVVETEISNVGANGSAPSGPHHSAPLHTSMDEELEINPSMHVDKTPVTTGTETVISIFAVHRRSRHLCVFYHFLLHDC